MKDLKILKETHKNKYNSVYVDVLCHCGVVFNTQRGNIRNGRIKSCGCGKIEAARKVGRMNRTHGESRNNYMYSLWGHIKQRCYSENCKDYKNYGARGISMFWGWDISFGDFKHDILNEIGGRPEGHSLDRIDNDGNYEPNNIRWATPLMQNNNKR